MRPARSTRRRSMYQLARCPEDSTKSPDTTAYLRISRSSSSRSLTACEPRPVAEPGYDGRRPPGQPGSAADTRRIHRTAYAVSRLEYAGVARGAANRTHGAGGWALVTSRVEEGRCRVDRCALFVDAGYMLADGAPAAHG